MQVIVDEIVVDKPILCAGGGPAPAGAAELRPEDLRERAAAQERRAVKSRPGASDKRNRCFVSFLEFLQVLEGSWGLWTLLPSACCLSACFLFAGGEGLQMSLVCLVELVRDRFPLLEALGLDVRTLWPSTTVSDETVSDCFSYLFRGCC